MGQLIYHSEVSYDGGESPFDKAIRATTDANSVWLVCPYISPSYLRSVLSETDRWRVITDVEAWVGTFGGATRGEIQELIEKNRERVHHFPDVHAKVIISEESAVVGSANLTEKGVLGRTEMGVQFEEERTIKELREWFRRLWSESSSVDMVEFQEFVQSSSETPTTRSSSTASVSSDAPRVKARFTEGEYSEDGFESSEDALSVVMNVIRRSPSQEWVESFFDLLQDVIATWKLTSDDPRLVISVAQSDRIAISINNRYVLGAFLANEPSIGFILKHDTKHLATFIEKADAHEEYKALSGEDDEDTPHWVEYNGYPKRMMSDSFRHTWMNAISEELDRAEGSPYQRYHEPIVYQMAVDPVYKKQALQKAFFAE